MHNYEHVIKGLEKAYADVRAGKGAGIGIIGPSGIGKTYIVNKFLSKCKNDVFSLDIKGLPIAQSAYSAIYEGMFNSIPVSEIRKEILVRLLKKYSRLLPGFGKCVSPLLDINSREALADVISKSSLPIGVSPAPHIIRFLNELAGKKSGVLIFDDVQWIDPETWSCLVYIAENLSTMNWLVIVVFNDRVETWTQPIGERLGIIDRWRMRPNELKWTFFHAERWTIESLPSLCDRVLGRQCQFPIKNIERLYHLSTGIPLFLRSILDYLLENDLIIFIDNRYEPSGDWESLDIGREIHDSIIHRLEKIYKEIPNSRQSLEVASVLGEPFSDEAIDGILDLCNSFQLLSEIEKKSLLIQYIFQKRHWIFQHNQVRTVIYKSLGPVISRRLHRKVGQYLEEHFPDQHRTIAYHYEITGDVEKEIQHLNSEIEKLLGQSLFNSALMTSENAIAKISQQASGLSEALHFSSIFLHGRCLFHLVRYREAISDFTRILNDATSKNLLASIHRWLGRCYMKLDSQEDFKFSIDHLINALSMFNALGNIKEMGETNSDLVVAYAHLNRFGDSEAAFIEAEKIFNQSKDRLGMARLQRRNVIFMESEVSAPILEKLAATFQEFGIPHERIMALNNGATEYIYLDNFKKSRQMLEAALEESTDIGDFGQVYLYNNLCLVYFMLNDIIKAKECIRHARSGRQREVEQLIIDINESALISSIEEIDIAFPLLERSARNAKKTGEKAYYFPSIVNLSLGYFMKGDVRKALDIAKTINPEKLNSFSTYKNSHWFRLMSKCYKAMKNDAYLEALFKDYSWCVDDTNRKYYDTDFCFVDMQFWSD